MEKLAYLSVEQTTHLLESKDDLIPIKNNGMVIYLLRDFVTGEEIDSLLNTINTQSQPSPIYPPVDDLNFRTSNTTFLSQADNEIVERINVRLSNFMGLSTHMNEGMQAQIYEIGQQFKPHYDFFEKDSSIWKEHLRTRGQRIWTAMIYLQKAARGGATFFPKVGIRLTPRPGSLLIWCNLLNDGAENYLSLHCGEPVESGRKVVITTWLRDQPQAAS